MESKSNLPSGKKAAKSAGTKKASKQSKASEPVMTATPTKKASAKKAPAKQAPAKKAASKQAPAKKAAKVIKAPAKQAPAKKAASKQAPAKKVAKVIKAPAKKASAKKAAAVVAAPAQKAASKQAPAKQAASKQAASKQAPAKQAASKQAPAEKAAKAATAPVKKAPAQKPRPAPTSPSNGAPSPSNPAQLQVGDLAPSFELADQTGKLVSSSELAGKPYVLYFYPKDNTPGCTTEACAFRDLHPSFGEIGVNVFGVSADSSKSHAGFAGKYELPFTLLADTDKQLINAYGTWVSKKNYGRDYMGIERSTFLIDAAGTLKHAWRSVKVNGHAQAVLEEARKLA